MEQIFETRGSVTIGIFPCSNSAKDTFQKDESVFFRKDTFQKDESVFFEKILS